VRHTAHNNHMSTNTRMVTTAEHKPPAAGCNFAAGSADLEHDCKLLYLAPPSLAPPPKPLVCLCLSCVPLSAAELVAAQRLEAAERRKMEEKERRLKQVRPVAAGGADSALRGRATSK